MIYFEGTNEAAIFGAVCELAILSLKVQAEKFGVRADTCIVASKSRNMSIKEKGKKKATHGGRVKEENRKTRVSNKTFTQPKQEPCLSLRDNILLISGLGCGSRNRPQPKAITASQHPSMSTLPLLFCMILLFCLDLKTFLDELAEFLCMGLLHHGEVVAAHHTELHLIAAELSPTVVSEVSAVVQQPLHGCRVLLLSWWRARVTRVTSNTITAPDSVGLDRLQRRLRLVVRERTNGGAEVRKQPLGSLGRVTSTKETNLIEEDMETLRKRCKVDGARGVKKKQALDFFAVGKQSLSNGVGNDTTSRPTTDDVGALRLASLDLSKVEERDSLNATSPVSRVLHKRAVESKGSNIRANVRYADIRCSRTRTIGQEEDLLGGNLSIALEKN
ncbi:polyketide synthase, partial [Aureobasidium melanogenum]